MDFAKCAAMELPSCAQSENSSAGDNDDSNLLLTRIELLIKRAVFLFSVRSFSMEFGFMLGKNISRHIPIMELSNQIIMVLAKQIWIEAKKMPSIEYLRLFHAIDLKYSELGGVLSINTSVKPLHFFAELFGQMDSFIISDDLEPIATFLTAEARDVHNHFSSVDSGNKFKTVTSSFEKVSEWVGSVLQQNLVEYCKSSDLLVSSEYFGSQNSHKTEQKESNTTKASVSKSEDRENASANDAKENIVLVNVVTQPLAASEPSTSHQILKREKEKGSPITTLHSRPAEVIENIFGF